MRKDISLTEHWNCGCGQTWTLRERRCPCCRQPMPRKTRLLVFREELQLQKWLRKDFLLQRSQRRMTKLNTLLCKATPLVWLLAIAVCVAFVAALWSGRDQLRPLEIGNRLPTVEMITEQTELRSRQIGQTLERLEGKFVGWPDRWVPTFRRLEMEWDAVRTHIGERTQQLRELFEERLQKLEEKKEIVEEYVK